MIGKKLCRPFQVVKNISVHPSFKPSVNESKVSHQLLLNGKLVTNRKFRSDGKKSSEGLGFKKLSATEVLEATISNLNRDRTAARLAQLGERRSAEREAVVSNPGRTNTQGL